jgi:autotransporter-associated beta strand protein
MGAIAAILLLAGGEAWAASGTWNVDSGGNWNSNANWSASPCPDGVGQSASLTYNLTVANAVVTQNVANVTLGSLTIGDPTTTFYTYTLTNTATETITLDADGAGGGIWITKNSSNAKKDIIAVPIILKGNLSVTNTSNTSGTELILNGVISEAGGKRKVTARTGGTSAYISLNGANTYSGKTTWENGLLNFNSIKNVNGGASALGAPTNVVDGTIAIGSGANACIFVYTGAGDTTDRILDLVGTTGTIQLRQSGTGKLTYTSSFSSSSGGGAKNLQLYAGGTLIAEIRGVIADYGGVTTLTAVNGGASSGSSPGIWNLLGLNTYTGPTTIESAAALLINTIGNVTVPGGASSLGAPTNTTDGTITMGSSTDRRCRLKYVGTGHSTDRSLAFAGTSSGERILTASGAGKLTLAGGFSAASQTVDLNLVLDGSGEGEMQGVIANPPGRVTNIKKGASAAGTEPTTGTWTLKGNNTFTGTVTLNHSGRLIMGHANALGLGAGAIALTAGTLDPGDAARTIANAITLTAHTIAGASNMTFSGKVTGVSGSTTSSRILTSSLDSGKVLTLSGGLDLVVTGDTAARAFTLAGIGDTTINSVIANGNTYANLLYLRNRGTTKINRQNTYTGTTSILGGGTVILNYDTADGGENASHLADANLYLASLSSGGAQLGGVDLVLKGGDHAEILGTTTYWGNGAGNAGHVNVNRPSGTAMLVMNAFSIGTGFGTINFGADDLASTTTANLSGGTADGILGAAYGARAPATVAGTDWACNSGVAHPSGGNYIRAYAGYTQLPTATGGNANNYTNTGNITLTADVAAGTVKLLGNGTLYLGSGTARNLNVKYGLLYAGTEGQTYTISDNGLAGNVFNSDNEAANIHVKAGDLVFDCAWGGALGRHLIKSGKGRLTLQKASSSTGSIVVNEGVVRLKNSTACGTTASGISVAESAYGSALELEAGISIGAETLIMNGNGIANGGAMRNISGNNSYAGPITIHFQGARINSDQDTLTLAGGITTAAGNDVTIGGAGNITVNTATITGAGAVTKDGAGTLELAAANDYTGATMVNVGTLKLTGSIAAGSKVTVNSGATLSGSGTCNGEVWVKSNGTVKAEGGNLTVGNLALFAGSKLLFDGTNKVVVANAGSVADQTGLTIIPGAQVQLAGALPTGLYTNLVYSGQFNGSPTSLTVANPASNATYTFSTNSTGTAITLAVVVKSAGTVVLVR